MNTGLGRRQRQVLDDLASIGCWRPAAGRGIGLLDVSAVNAVLATLAHRSLVAFTPDSRGGLWALTPGGYACLIHRAADDMGWMSTDSPAYEQVTTRVGHLATLARLAVSGPVNWRGEPC